MTSENIEFEKPPSLTKPVRTGKPWYKKWWGLALIVFLTLFSVVSLALAIYVGRVVVLLRTGAITPEELLGREPVGPLDRVKTMATSDDPSFGPSNAQVVIVEFSDFQCPFCAQAYPVIKELLKDYGDRIHFVYRDFPVPSLHPQALLGALAGECAHEQGKFWPMHDKIFENQQDLNENNLKTWAIQLGLDGVQFSSCLDSQKYLPEVQEDLNDGVDAGVRATPTFFINGQKIEGALPLSVFEQIILTILNN